LKIKQRNGFAVFGWCKISNSRFRLGLGLNAAAVARLARLQTLSWGRFPCAYARGGEAVLCHPASAG